MPNTPGKRKSRSQRVAVVSEKLSSLPPVSLQIPCAGSITSSPMGEVMYCDSTFGVTLPIVMDAFIDSLIFQRWVPMSVSAGPPVILAVLCEACGRRVLGSDLVDAAFKKHVHRIN